ncbi:hypothetical protein BX600DRAFT_539978 [Xylariales sp. PMI_506]|nr:hypothetical protein BX600DRAFT_539978 [Xylariales sp. PMI_506]
MSSIITKSTTWETLPREIQLRILEFVLSDGCSLAQLATVSTQWQTIIERHNFQQINLTLWRIPDFGPMTRRNRALVKHIRLSLEIDEYDCSKCGAQGNLKLDISVHSPSDSQHFFKYLTFGPDTYLHSDETYSDEATSQRDDSEHGWQSGKLSSAPTDSALGKVFAEILGASDGVFFNDLEESKWWQTLPEIPAITSILLRLQNRPTMETIDDYKYAFSPS